MREPPAGEEASVFLNEDVCGDEVLTQGQLPVYKHEFAIHPPAAHQSVTKRPDWTDSHGDGVCGRGG